MLLFTTPITDTS